MRNQAHMTVNTQQQQYQINRLLREIQDMQVQQQEGREYSAMTSNVLHGSATTTVSPFQNELQNILQRQIQRQMLSDRFSTTSTLHHPDRSMETSLQYARYLCAQRNHAQQQHLTLTSDPTSRSPVSAALANARFTGLGGLGPNLPASAQSPLSSIPLSLPVLLVRPRTEENRLSQHQRLLRQQLEVFEADHEDVTTHIRGRNKLISYGQVGIRCKHCSHVAVAKRQKGSTYFPSTKLGLYQAAQNMSTTHIQSGACRYIPESVKIQFSLIADLKQRQCDTVTSSSNHGAGRPYWAECASRLGLVDTEPHGIRFIRTLPSNAVVVDESYWNDSRTATTGPRFTPPF